MRGLFEKFFADRGTHLAAMIAYFALLSFVPLVFLALALLGFAGRADASSALVKELNRLFPSTSIASIVRVVNAVRDNAAALGLFGGIFVLWTSISLFSALESALNIVYGRPNRSFLRGKAVAIAMMISSLIVLFAGLVVGTIGVELFGRAAPGVISNRYVAYATSVLVSGIAAFVFLVSVYYFLTNVEHKLRDVLPGAVLASVLLEATFQVLPLYVRFSRDIPTAQAFGGPVLLLVWLYLMANVIVLGAEVNWWLWSKGRARDVEEGAGLA